MKETRSEVKPAGTFLDVFRRHAAAEFRQDMEETLSTVCHEPYYAIQPLGWIIRDKALLRDFYLSMFAMMRRLEPVPGTDGSSQIFQSDAGVVEWVRALQHRDAEGRVTPLDFVAIIVRDPQTGEIKGEMAYLSEASAALFRRCVDPTVQERMTAS